MNGPVPVAAPFIAFPDRLPAQGQAGSRLEFALACMVAFFAPMNFLRLDGVYITLSDIAAIAFCAVLITNRSVPGFRLGAAASLWLCGVALLAVFLLASSMVNNATDRGLVVSGQYLHAYLVLPLVFLSRPAGELATICKFFLLSIVFLCLFGVYLIHVDGETNTRFVSGNGRLRSFVERSNEAAALIAMSLPVALFLGATGKLRSVTVALMFLVFLYGIVLTGSNSGLLALFFGLGLYMLMSLNWRSIVAGAVLAIGFAGFLNAGGASLLPQVFQERVLGALVSGDIDKAGTYAHRVDLIREASAFANETGLLGIGANRYASISEYGQPVHNAYLLLWVEGGLPAMTGLLIIIAAALYSFVRLKGKPGSGPVITFGVSVTLIYAAFINAIPHVYGRFWVVPMLLALATAWRFYEAWLLGAKHGRTASGPYYYELRHMD